MANWSGECHVLPTPPSRDGYRRMGRRKKHRVEYEKVHGPIEPGLVLHHECGNKGCFNPEHLTPMTRAEHIRLHDHTWQIKETCIHGHPRSEFYAYDTKYPRCRECNRLYMAARKGR